MVVKQYSIHWISLDPTKGSEVSKTRPCVVISPNELNKFLNTIIVAPLTSTIKAYPSRVFCEVGGRKGSIMLDQMRAVDKTRLGTLLGKLTSAEAREIRNVINLMLC